MIINLWYFWDHIFI